MVKPQHGCNNIIGDYKGAYKYCTGLNKKIAEALTHGRFKYFVTLIVASYLQEKPLATL